MKREEGETKSVKGNVSYCSDDGGESLRWLLG